ncbi:MAG: hypothetical protein CVU09_17550 [Bacteroidetes bacterium HGW-Bacteroidetes-4]|jgi:hypothetical protein|nr:MAG: hypothetical protein CVU09_17550 [Bacteroidetes bacterium HGW-Bacteroidetes-4]
MSAPTVYTTVCKASRKWNATGVRLHCEREYHIKATGTWTDFYISTDAHGFERNHLRPFKRFKRQPDAHWFALMGSIGKESPYFLVGADLLLKPDKAGELFLFANDMPAMYWNNRGSLSITITEYKPQNQNL